MEKEREQCAENFVTLNLKVMGKRLSPVKEFVEWFTGQGTYSVVANSRFLNSGDGGVHVFLTILHGPSLNAASNNRGKEGRQ